MKFEAAGDRTNVTGISGYRERLGTAARLVAAAVTLAALFGAAGCGQTGKSSGANASSKSAQLSPSSSGVAFGNVAVGTSASELVTITAAGSQSVTISSVTTSGTGFTVSPQSNVVLAPSQSLTISVGFQPKSTGSAAGKLLVASNAANSSLDISLSGAGVTGGNHSVTLSWQPSASAVTGYFVFRGSSSSTLSQLNANALPATSYTDNTIAGGQTYIYAVKSISASNALSTYSNYVTVAVPAD